MMKYQLTHTTILAALTVCGMQAGPTIQKLKKVSKPDDGKEWIVTVYEINTQHLGQGRQVSQSKFKKNTDGLLTNKLSFDFSNTPLNKIVYGPHGKECEIIIREFKPINNLTAELKADCTINFKPKVRIISVNDEIPQLAEANYDTRQVNVAIPATGTWTIVSGDLTPSKLNEKDKYKLDEISVSSQIIEQDPNKGLLTMYTALPSKIAAKKEGDSNYTITVLKQADLNRIKETRIITIDEKGKASPGVQKALVAKAIAPEKALLVKIHVPSQSEILKPKLSADVIKLQELLLANQQNEWPTTITDTSYYVERQKYYTFLSKNSKSNPYQFEAESDGLAKQLQTLRSLQPIYAAFLSDASKAKELLEALLKAEENFHNSVSYERGAYHD